MTITRVKVRRLESPVKQAKCDLYRAAIALQTVMESTGAGTGPAYPFGDKPFDAVISDLIRWAEATQ